jgi:hypothetical protein
VRKGTEKIYKDHAHLRDSSIHRIETTKKKMNNKIYKKENKKKLQQHVEVINQE